MQETLRTRPDAPAEDHGIPFGEAVRVWLRVAALSFGGPAGQIAVMHRILVDEKKWVGERRFLHALNFCMLLPGPEAQQLTIYLGWLLHKTKGGLVAGTLFVVPGFLAILALSWVYVLLGDVPAIEGLFFGLKAAVLAIVVSALVKIASRALQNNVLLGIAGLAFVAIFGFGVLFPLIVLGAGLVGYLGTRLGSTAFRLGGGHGGKGDAGLSDAESALGAGTPDHARPSRGWTIRIATIFLLLWLGPLLLLMALAGPDHVFSEIALFFSKMAVVTFGGAYAVLAYVAQEAVQNYGWLRPGEMLDGLGMAETTPGPLIQVVQFVGFMGAFRDPGTLPPLLAATMAALLTTWVTFVPCFLWIFLGAPFSERLRDNKALTGALSAITAAVVGVILNLVVWFAIHSLFAEVSRVERLGLALELPMPGSVDPAALVLTSLALLAVFRFNLGTGWTLAGAALLGMMWIGLS